MTVCLENLHHAQKLQKRAHNKGVKPTSYASGDKVWLNSKYIKTKSNRKLNWSQVLWTVLSFTSSRKASLQTRASKAVEDPQYFLYVTAGAGHHKEGTGGQTNDGTRGWQQRRIQGRGYWDSAVYTNKSESGQLPGLYYLVEWKGYSEEENIWKPLSAVQQLKKLISCFHKEYPEKPITISPLINSALSMARPTVRPTSLKRKQSWPAGGASKQAKNWVFRCWWHLMNSLDILAHNWMELA